VFDVKNQQRNLLPQMTAQVFFVAAEAHDTLVVPAGAVKLARMAPGSRRGQQQASGPAGEPPRGEASAGHGQPPQAGATAPGKEGKEGKAAANHQEAKRQAPPANAAMGAGSMPPPPAGERPAGFGGAPLSDAEREARRKQFESMTPEQREAWRARRAEQRQAQGEGGMPPAGARGGATQQAAAANPGKTDKAGKAATPAADTARVKPRALPVWSGVGSGGRQQRVREGTVRVVLPDNSIVERKVTVGITDRVSYQVLGGLKPGERVIVGEKAQDKEAARKSSNRNADMGPPPGMGAPGMGAGR